MDRKTDGRAKIFSLEQDDLWVEALVPADSGMGPSESISFQVAAISHLRSLGPGHTVIALSGGPEIVIALPKNELLERMSTGAPGEALDLKSDTVLQPRPQLMQKLRENFAQAQLEEKYGDICSLTFTAFVRTPQQKDFTEITFSGRDIQPDKISEGGSIMGGNVLTFTLKKPDARFEAGQFLLESTLQEFNDMCRKARELGQATLDLREYSMRKGKLTSEERAQKAPQLKDFHRGGP